MYADTYSKLLLFTETRPEAIKSTPLSENCSIYRAIDTLQEGRATCTGGVSLKTRPHPASVTVDNQRLSTSSAALEDLHLPEGLPHRQLPPATTTPAPDGRRRQPEGPPEVNTSTSFPILITQDDRTTSNLARDLFIACSLLLKQGLAPPMPFTNRGGKYLHVRKATTTNKATWDCTQSDKNTLPRQSPGMSSSCQQVGGASTPALPPSLFSTPQKMPGMPHLVITTIRRREMVPAGLACLWFSIRCYSSPDRATSSSSNCSSIWGPSSSASSSPSTTKPAALPSHLSVGMSKPLTSDHTTWQVAKPNIDFVPSRQAAAPDWLLSVIGSVDLHQNLGKASQATKHAPKLAGAMQPAYKVDRNSSLPRENAAFPAKGGALARRHPTGRREAKDLQSAVHIGECRVLKRQLILSNSLHYLVCWSFLLIRLCHKGPPLPARYLPDHCLATPKEFRIAGSLNWANIRRKTYPLDDHPYCGPRMQRYLVCMYSPNHYASNTIEDAARHPDQATQSIHRVIFTAPSHPLDTAPPPSKDRDLFTASSSSRARIYTESQPLQVNECLCVHQQSGELLNPHLTLYRATGPRVPAYTVAGDQSAAISQYDPENQPDFEESVNTPKVLNFTSRDMPESNMRIVDQGKAIAAMDKAPNNQTERCSIPTCPRAGINFLSCAHCHNRFHYLC
ncbi:hypothetical protein PR048_028540 [Dryococelus australis]|uniref:Uncharacterized protein n=1 Tax=Dryococelus australis TaxID=614101 RepID=A0ABQ9GEN3_9NEOP|nr:hypothetical protein PR048_028540 [Dryococelus australis]